MSVSPSKKDIEDIGLELDTEPVFLEKDWHISLIVEALSALDDDKFEPVFCGGTCLLQAYRLINRFSEDVDFRIISKDGEPSTRHQRRLYREKLLQSLSQIPEFEIVNKTIKSRDSSRFFSAMLKYEKHFSDHRSLRPEIKIDGTFVDHHLPGLETRVVKPIIGDYITVDHVSIKCLSLLETTTDKASALIWRVLSRDRTSADDDQTMIRHLHDRYPLLGALANENNSLRKHLIEAYGRDFKRGGNVSQDLSIASSQALAALESDTKYRQEYENFVINMCFGKADGRISFDQALDRFRVFVGMPISKY